MYQLVLPGDVSGQRRAAMQTEEADHLAELSDGAGCTEIWEHLSERREADEAAAEEATADGPAADPDDSAPRSD